LVRGLRHTNMLYILYKISFFSDHVAPLHVRAVMQCICSKIDAAKMLSNLRLC